MKEQRHYRDELLEIPLLRLFVEQISVMSVSSFPSLGGGKVVREPGLGQNACDCAE